jgi:twinkle protein
VDIIKDEIDFSVYENRDEWHKVKPASEWLEEVMSRFANPDEYHGDPLPWSKVDGYRMRRSEVSVWFGINGHGKSMMLSQVMLNTMATGKRVVIASMEMTPVKTMMRMVRQASCGDNPHPSYIHNFHKWTDGRLWIYDHLGMVKPEKMLALLRYCHEKLQADHVVVDSLMKCGMAPDDYGKQKSFVDGLCGVALETGMHIHLVAHARKGDKETDRLDKFDLKGSSEIADQVDNLLIVSRNKGKENDKEGKRADEPDAFLSVVKQRHGDWEGTAGLWYDHPSQSYTSGERAPVVGVDL